MLAGVDLRTHAGRRYREICADLVAHLGGDVTFPQEAIIRRAAQLCIWCEAQETSHATGGPFDIERYNGAANTLRRLLVDIGYHRALRDVTPSLEAFIQARSFEDAS